jgi:hypothetical protein
MRASRLFVCTNLSLGPGQGRWKLEQTRSDALIAIHCAFDALHFAFVCVLNPLVDRTPSTFQLEDRPIAANCSTP